MVDLHSHTDRSDGVLPPARLVELACSNRLSALGITDHDTIQGYDDAVPFAADAGLELICGVELSAPFDGRTIHVLGYFLEGDPGEEFRARLEELKDSRRDRNRRLTQRLQELGLDVTLAEAEALGAEQTGRPHFARILVEKGYASDFRDAFDRWLDAKAPGFVPRKEASLEAIAAWIREAGGVASWAHPGRHIKASPKSLAQLFSEVRSQGVPAIECYHRDHTMQEGDAYAEAARSLGMGVTGGSDFHAPNGVDLGGLRLPDSLLADLRDFAATSDGGRRSNGTDPADS